MEKADLLHRRAIRFSGMFRKTEADLLEVLQEIDREKYFRRFGCASTFEYATTILKLSEANASNFITVARKAHKVPAMIKEIREGNITVSKARKMAPVIHLLNAAEWLEKGRKLSKRELEREVARVNPQAATRERARYVAEGRIQLEVGVEDRVMSKIRRAQEVLAQKRRKAVSMEETLDWVFEEVLERHDPVRKGSQPRSGSGKERQCVPGHIPARVKNEVFHRDEGQCTYLDSSGKRCSNRQFLEMDHIVARARGGGEEPDNLRLLCFNHHRIRHGRLSLMNPG